MRKWRVAVLGLGHWYSAYGLARALPEYPRAELVAVGWHNPAQLAEFACTFGVDGYTDYDAVLARDDVDIVHIAAPVSEIADLAIRAARAGQAHHSRQAHGDDRGRGRSDGRGRARRRRHLRRVSGD